MFFVEKDLQKYFASVSVWEEGDVYRLSKVYEKGGQKDEKDVSHFDSKTFAKAVRSLQSHDSK